MCPAARRLYAQVEDGRRLRSTGNDSYAMHDAQRARHRSIGWGQKRWMRTGAPVSSSMDQCKADRIQDRKLTSFGHSGDKMARHPKKRWICAEVSNARWRERGRGRAAAGDGDCLSFTTFPARGATRERAHRAPRTAHPMPGCASAHPDAYDPPLPSQNKS